MKSLSGELNRIFITNFMMIDRLKFLIRVISNFAIGRKISFIEMKQEVLLMTILVQVLD